MRYDTPFRFFAASRSSPGPTPLPYLHFRRQMPVGQGGFHVGALRRANGPFGPVPIGTSVSRFNGADYLYAYDCGSEPKRHVHREINSLRDGVPDGQLDLLVLSHFDRDHICGTPHLLRSEGFQVDTIMLPFVDMDERIIALAQAAAETGDHGGSIDSFFVNMVFDPIATLAEFRPRRIIFVRDGDDDTPLYGGGGPEFDPDFGVDLEMKTAIRRRREPLRTELIAAYPNGQRLSERVDLSTSGNMQVLAVRNMAMAVHDTAGAIDWKLTPWVRRADPAHVATFRRLVEAMFGWRPDTFAAQIMDQAIRKQMVTTKRTKLAAAYKTAFGDKNLTSLCLYSGPLRPEWTDAFAFSHKLPNSSRTKIGWLGTGDAHLRDADDIAAFERGYADDLPFVSAFTLPHHGSIANSDPAHLISDADVWIAAADPIHKWDHPAWQLQGAVAALGGQFRHVRSYSDTACDEAFLVVARG